MTDLNEMLTKVLTGAWARLYESAEVRDAGFRMTQFASIGPDGAPRLRTVVLRGASFEECTVRFHTDSRSPKIAEISANGSVSLVSYNRASGEQIRIEGQAIAHHRNDFARTAWQASQGQSRICYRTAFSPGAPLSSVKDADITDAMRTPNDEDIGFEHFCAVVITVRRLDWLDLAASGHRRAVFDWTGDEWRGKWVAP
jgi:pyridoxamine 5'-phosphate oxidase